MKKIGIITLCGNNNFGNKLQNYALIKSVEKMVFYVYDIWVKNTYESHPVKSILKMVKNKIVLNKLDRKREKKFKCFHKDYIKTYYRKIIFNDD